MPVSIKLNTKALDKAIDKFPATMYSEMKKSFRIVGRKYQATLIKERLSGPGPKSLARRSGALARSFDSTTVGSNIRSLTMVVYTDSKYARIHEYGGKIKPKKSKYLAIPLDAAKTAAGVSRYKSPRDAPDLKFGGMSRADNPILRTIDGTPMYVLVKSVTIKPRLGMRETWSKTLPKTVQLLNTAVGEVLRRF